VPIFERIETYSVAVGQNDLPHERVIRLSLESGGTVHIDFVDPLPEDWLQFVFPPPPPGGIPEAVVEPPTPHPALATNVWMTIDKFDDVYHLLQSEAPVFFTGLVVAGFRVALVHTELDLTAGERPGEGDEDPDTIEAMIRRARSDPASAAF
jgi:hypothetical protein